MQGVHVKTNAKGIPVLKTQLAYTQNITLFFLD